MKCEPLSPKPIFNPIVLTLETMEEAAAVYAAFNHTTVSSAIGQGEWDAQEPIRKAVLDAGNDQGRFFEITKAYHKNLQDILK